MQNALNIIKLQKNLPSVHPAPEKKVPILFIPLFLHVSDRSGPAPTQSPLPIEKVQIFTFLIPLKM